MINIKMRVLVVLLCYLFLKTYGRSVSPYGIKRACGSALTDLVARICNSDYAQDDQPILSIDSFDYSDTIISPKRAKVLIKHTRMKRDGIANECCDKACSLTEIIEYCGSQY